jgi:hypothetical protein
MNISKFLVTVLGAAQYTSAWWWLSTIVEPNVSPPHAYTVISIITVLGGTIGIIIGGITYLIDNWNK